MDEQVFRKIWGRRQARPLKTQQKSLMQDKLPLLQIELNPGTPLDIETLFQESPSRLYLEIGFGGGEHLAARAAQQPKAAFIGCEPFVNGVVSMLQHIEEGNLTNIRLVVDDARLLLQSLPEACLDGIYILFPDPWPKKRHNKRRIVSDETIGELSRVLRVGGQLIMATDIADYAEWMQEVLVKRAEFTLNLEERNSIHERPHTWPSPSRYEKKGTACGRQSAYFVYDKLTVA